MITFPSGIKFKFPWRKYQARVLNELEEHLEDNHLHVIAPPGSGKTVLGLEVMLCLNKPTLILAPTIAIRNQWIQRFCESFLQVETAPDWISRDIRKPGFVTVSTYQGVHAVATNENIIEDELEELEADDSEESKVPGKAALKQLIESLQEQKVGTIVIDEAHHLKNAWWKTLMALKEELAPNPTVLGLTATPPYDVSFSEWSRYVALNGPVDTEISVPELVQEGDLSPHQDYLHFSYPTREELEKITTYRKNIDKVFDFYARNLALRDTIENLPAIRAPAQHLDWIYGNMEVYSSILIYLENNMPILSEYHFTLTGNQRADIPKLNKEWMEVLLNFYLKFLKENPDKRAMYKSVLENLKTHGAIQHSKVALSNDDEIESILKSSLSKLQSILEIARFEYQCLNQSLRLVILSDFIRKEFLNDHVELTRMGVAPTFELLRRNLPNGLRLGVLTGSLIIIPSAAFLEFEKNAATYGIDHIPNSFLEYDNDYLIIKPTDKLRQDLVHIITQVFEAGHINVLVGTKSLLGEGWDAPSVNTLILASFIGSFVLSNQMRGRAIRTTRKNPKKTGNIWHLVCQDPTQPQGGPDFKLMERRFRGFLGISERENRTIENGLLRMELPEIFGHEALDNLNARMLKSAGERDILRRQWHDAIHSGTILHEEIKIPYAPASSRNYKQEKKFYLGNSIKNFAAGLGGSMLSFSLAFADYLSVFANIPYPFSPMAVDITLGVFGAGFLGLYGNRLTKSARLYFKYRDISKDLDGVAKALLKALVETKDIKTPLEQLKVVTSVNEFGEVYCHLEGATTYGKSIFIQSLEEIVSSVENPRYLVIRKSRLFKLFGQRDYHAVPELLARKANLAAIFKKHWLKEVGPCEVIFARSEEGRAQLLKARFNNLAAELEPQAELISRWK